MKYTINCHPSAWPTHRLNLQKSLDKNECIINIVHEDTFHYISTAFIQDIENNLNFNGKTTQTTCLLK